MKGRGVAQNDVEAVRLYRKAADQNFANAQNNLGWMYLNGRGVARDLNKAGIWFRKAASSSDPETVKNARDFMKQNKISFD